MSLYRENMKFEYNIVPIQKLVKFNEVGRSGIGPEKCHFVFDRIFRNGLLICEVREILSEMDS